MRIFDPKYICCKWDDSLKGKAVFYGDNVGYIEDEVQGMNLNTKGKVIGPNDDDDMPFKVEGASAAFSTWRYVYYDANYDCKVAYSQGKQIQFRSSNGQWEDVKTPVWSTRDVYRVKPDGPKEHVVQATEFPSLCGYCIHRKDGCIPKSAGKCVNFFSTNDDYFRVKKDYVDLVKEHVELERKYGALVSGIQQLMHGYVNC